MAMFIVAFSMFTREHLPREKGPYFPGWPLELGKLWDAVGWHWESCDTSCFVILPSGKHTKKLLNMAIEKVDLSIKHDDFP